MVHAPEGPHARPGMSYVNGDHSDELVVTAAHGASAHCVARLITAAFDACEEAEMPLSQLQRTALVEAALLEFDGFDVHLRSLAVVGRMLDDLGER